MPSGILLFVPRRLLSYLRDGGRLHALASLRAASLVVLSLIGLRHAHVGEGVITAAATAGGAVALEELLHRLDAGGGVTAAALALLVVLIVLIIIDRGDEMDLGVGVDDVDLDLAVLGHRLGDLVQDLQAGLLRAGLLFLLLHLDSLHNLAHVDRSFLCVDLSVVKP